MTVVDSRRSMAQLRLEVLKSRALNRDPITGLPTLPAVLEEVRKLLDGKERISVFQIGFEGEQNLEERLGWSRYDELLKMMAGRLKRMVEELGASEQTILCQSGVFSETFVLFSADPRSLGEILRVQEAGLVDPGEGGVHHGLLSIRSGRGAVIRDPKQRIERCIYAGLEQAQSDWRRQGALLDEERMVELRRLIRERSIRTLFQPIRRMEDLGIEGFEALSRGPDGGYFEMAENLFGFAERAGLLGEIELLCLEKALANSHLFRDGGLLFLNLSNAGLEYVEAEGGGLVELVGRKGFDTSRVVLEITERTFAENPSVLQGRVEKFRQAGVRVAIDDMGAGYSSLHIVAELRPDFIKLDQLLVRDLPSSTIKQNLVAALLRFAKDTSSEVIAEGVEKASEAQVLEKLGVGLVQGFHFGYPSLPSQIAEFRSGSA